ncbi:Ankyrin Repeat [Seminavis robusta]|uniref:Ankyrin Repeat n=1 Tax=Seminavis robusta TaxID=568900 RepID=A0A9N8DPQ4_9STRA|nr:Ankyrin Repeat [Seminavis robusta]|eukprot:Sro266_g103030.1 Ankyrin Repeat (612) ;mRNA; r:13151-14986
MATTTTETTTMKEEDARQRQEEETEEEARNKVRSILCNSVSTPRQREQALELLQAHPALASQVYRETTNESPCLDTNYTPLAYFILTGAPVQQIATVYALAPSAITYTNARGRLPLHDACSLSASCNVIFFLAQEFPKAASIPDDCGLYPFHHALRARRPQPTLRMLLDLYPPALETRDFGGHLPLERALLEGHHADVLQLLFRRITTTTKQYRLFKSIDGTLSLVQGVSVLLPQLQAFHCELDTTWSTDAWTALVGQALAQDNTSIETLSLRLVRTLFYDAKAAESLRALLQSPTSNVRQLTLLGQAKPWHWDDETDAQSFQALHDGLTVRTSIGMPTRLKELRLCHFKLADTRLLSSLVASPQCPANVSLENIVVMNQEQQDGHACTSWSPLENNSRVRRLSLKSITGQWVCELLQDMLQRASLRHLAVESCHARGLSLVLLDFLRQTPMESLTAINLPSRDKTEDPYLPLTRALNDNTHLIKYHIQETLNNSDVHQDNNTAALASLLAQKNTTLQDTSIILSERRQPTTDEQIWYYTLLNRVGRKEAWDSGTSRECLTEQLCRTTMTNDLLDEDLFNAQYGLLRQNPSIWSSSPPNTRLAGRKRKSPI